MAAGRHLDYCCLQETGWKGEGARKLGVISSFGWGMRKGITEWGCWWLKNGSRRFGYETLEQENHGAESSCGKIRGESGIRVCTVVKERQGRKR